MSESSFLAQLNLDQEEAKLLVKAIFMANLVSDEEEHGPYSSIADAWNHLLIKVLAAASDQKLYNAKNDEEILESELNENDELEGLLTSFRTRIFWEELVSHIVGQKIEEKKIDLNDEELIEELYEEVEKEVQTKGLDVLKETNEN